MFSSHMPGHCYVNFDTWEECEEFLGFEVFQPLEDSGFEKGNYVGMPEGYNDASHIHVSFYGTNEGKVEWIQLESGYQNGDVRITVTTYIYVDIPRTESDVSIPTEEKGERYVAVTSTVSKGPMAYSIRIVGEPALRTQVKETMEHVLPYFTDNLE